MNGNKVLSSFSYWSVLFAPVLFPLIVWILGDHETKGHAKRALWTHLIPGITTFIGIVVLGIMDVGFKQPGTTMAIGAIIMVCICGLISLYFFIWNIVKGIRVIRA
ncbi:DUF4870 domain-containing protein [Bacillus pseudomycoides]|uniref:DUF4870 domain-containing protein n=1 Tax=Bacillus pseudomycoides TaxID=64104 RepID=UPI0001A15049|nr:DUF4870 domain-containing protein [Bacillus pseudomycoides]EEM03029.1 hypothetical protein bmyco0002_45940 [Bacillus pseudomycoides]KFN09289.1 tic20-like family protein [Bacillus pseudomycoides]MDR4188777.1 DUF4870 domain-containing protein [Bacillus pseudomycoides]MED0853561.1 DUF4870 domain-containing protein [Bacillus pseudomycoides]PGC44303.1 DUF4870 domain-containing protein [Bacillus pseudomycoides]